MKYSAWRWKAFTLCFMLSSASVPVRGESKSSGCGAVTVTVASCLSVVRE